MKNRYLKTYLYTLVGKELTYEDKEKILMYFNELKMENDRLKNKLKIYKSIISNLKRFCESRGDYEDYVIINKLEELQKENKKYYYGNQINGEIIYEEFL